jgi:hypothetical protein
MARYRDLLKWESVREDGTRNTLAVVDASGLSSGKRELFLQAYLEGGSCVEILGRIRATKEFSLKDAANIEATLAVNDFTLSDGRLLATLRRSIDEPAKVRTLAKMAQEDWLAAIDESKAIPPSFVAGDTPAEQRQNYATLLSKRAALAYPTAAFAGDFARALRSPQKPTVEHAEQILEFIDAHPAFELATTSIDGYIKNHAPAAFFDALIKARWCSSLRRCSASTRSRPVLLRPTRCLRTGSTRRSRSIGWENRSS